MKKTLFSIIALLFIMSLLLTGCGVSKNYVDRHLAEVLTAEIGNVKEDIEDIRQDVISNQREIGAVKNETREQSERMEKELSLVRDAMKRAKKGKLLYEVTISDEAVPFAYKKSVLSEDAKAQLDIFADVLIKENDDIYIEIQGHTDNIGSKAYNLKLGQERADAVLSYLHDIHQFPLHRINAFSYGESRPVADNDTQSNRAKNRRVMLIVME